MVRKLCSAGKKKDEQKKSASKEVIQYVERVLFRIERTAFFILAFFFLIRRCVPNKSIQREIVPGLVILFATIVFFQGCFYLRYLYKTRPETIGVKKAYDLANSVFSSSGLTDPLQFFEFLCLVIDLENIVFLSTIPPSFTWEPDLILALASFAGLYMATNVTRFCIVELIDNHDNGGGGGEKTAVLKARQDNDKVGEGSGGRAASGDVRSKEKEGFLGDRLLIAWQEEESLIRAELSEATAVVESLRRRSVPSPSINRDHSH